MEYQFGFGRRDSLVAVNLENRQDEHFGTSKIEDRFVAAQHIQKEAYHVGARVQLRIGCQNVIGGSVEACNVAQHVHGVRQTLDLSQSWKKCIG